MRPSWPQIQTWVSFCHWSCDLGTVIRHVIQRLGPAYVAMTELDQAWLLDAVREEHTVNRHLYRK